MDHFYMKVLLDLFINQSNSSFPVDVRTITFTHSSYRGISKRDILLNRLFLRRSNYFCYNNLNSENQIFMSTQDFEFGNRNIFHLCLISWQYVQEAKIIKPLSKPLFAKLQFLRSGKGYNVSGWNKKVYQNVL